MSEALRLTAECQKQKDLVKRAMEAEMTRRMDAKTRNEKDTHGGQNPRNSARD